MKNDESSLDDTKKVHPGSLVWYDELNNDCWWIDMVISDMGQGRSMGLTYELETMKHTKRITDLTYVHHHGSARAFKNEVFFP